LPAPERCRGEGGEGGEGGGGGEGAEGGEGGETYRISQSAARASASS
jgi:hypothetical protein